MSKNNKEKPSFWKKLGLGKNKSSDTTSSMKSDQDKSSVKSKRLSGMFIQQQIQQSDDILPPPMPAKPIKSQPRANLPKVIDGHYNITQQQPQQHVDITSSFSKEVDISTKPDFTPTVDILHQESAAILKQEQQQKQQKNDKLASSFTEQPNVTPAIVDKDDNNSNSSFIVVNNNATSSDNGNDTFTSDELLRMISTLKLDLEKEKATVNALQKQKEAVSKDLDYLELTVDELFAEKTDLLQQLEDEKIKSQQYLDDLNLSLEKQRSNADNARDQSFAVDQTKFEFESFQEQSKQEREELLSKITIKDKTIRELKAKYNKSQDQVESLKAAMEELAESHKEEIARMTAAAQAQASAKNENKSNGWALHTPNGSPRIKPNKDVEGDDEKWNNTESSPMIPVPSASTPFFNANNDNHYGMPQSMTRGDSADQHHYRPHKESGGYLDVNDLDDQLMKLLKEKEKLQSLYSKIPITGGGPQSRRRKEELEAMLDQVDSQLSKVKQKIRRV